MGIIGLQRRIREVGRIRLGDRVERGGRKVPRKLARFRFTSPDRAVIEACADAYGGKVDAWDNDGSPEFECYSDATEIPILIPPSELAFSQFFESWAKGFCTRRCDGEFDQITDGPCTCNAEARDCKATTRLSVILPEIAGLGVWRLESHGWYAAVEIGGAIELINAMAPARSILPARLRLSQRELRKLAGGEAKVVKIVVPVIDIDASVAQLQQQIAGAGAGPALAAADPVVGDGAAESAHESGKWQPVPPAPALEAPPIDEQLADAAAQSPPKTRGRAPLPATGRKPRTAAQRKAQTATEACPVCGAPYGDEPLVVNRAGRTLADGTVPRYVHRVCEDAAAAEPSRQRHPSAEDAPDPPAPTEGTPVPVEDDPPHGDRPIDGNGNEPDQRAPKPVTAKMHSKIFALLSEVMPFNTDTPGAEVDRLRRDYEMALCAALGAEGLTSHKQIDFELGRLLIDALEGIKSNTFIFDDGVLMYRETRTPVDWNQQEEPF